MNQQQHLWQEFADRHQRFVTDIINMQEELYTHSPNGKWSPQQHFYHILLCNLPLERALRDPLQLVPRFGRVERKTRTEDEVIQHYVEALKNGGKAPERFVPPGEIELSRKEIADKIMADATFICAHLNKVSDDDLDSILMPHPLLGSMTILEMLYLMNYHVGHHHKIVLQIQNQ